MGWINTHEEMPPVGKLVLVCVPLEHAPYKSGVQFGMRIHYNPDEIAGEWEAEDMWSIAKWPYLAKMNMAPYWLPIPDVPSDVRGSFGSC